jgi:cytidylate kinase
MTRRQGDERKGSGAPSPWVTMVPMGVVVVVTGPPGAGKSATADRLVDLFDPSALVPGDAFFGFLRNGAMSPWLEDAREQNTSVIQAAAAAVGRLAQHRDVVYDGVLGPWFLETFLRAAGVTHLHYAMLLPPLEVCLQRVRSRRGHGFTDHGAAEHMWWEMQRADVAPRFVVIDHQQPSGEIAALIAQRLEEGGLRYP